MEKIVLRVNKLGTSLQTQGGGGTYQKTAREGVLTKQPRKQWEVEENAGRLWWMREEKNGGPRDDEAKVENKCYRAP